MKISNILVCCFCIFGLCSCATSLTSDTTSTTSGAAKAVVSKNTIKTDFAKSISLVKTDDKAIFINSLNQSICNVDLANFLEENLLSKGYFLTSKDSANLILDTKIIGCEEVNSDKKLVVSMFLSQKDSDLVYKDILVTTSIKNQDMYLVEAVPLLEEEMAYQISQRF